MQRLQGMRDDTTQSLAGIIGNIVQFDFRELNTCFKRKYNLLLNLICSFFFAVNFVSKFLLCPEYEFSRLYYFGLQSIA